MNTTNYSAYGQTLFLGPPSYLNHSFNPYFSSHQAIPPPSYYDHRNIGEFGILERDNSRGRWNGNGAQLQGNGRNGVWEGEERGRMGRSVTRNSEHDHDHPSFSRPPHRTSQAGPPTSFEPSTLAPGVEFQLVSNTCTVPPPPPIELSAVPLAELATEMVWKACLSAQSIPTPILSPLTTDLPIWGDTKPTRSISSSSFEEVRGSPKTPELYFGAIGEGRLRREDSDSSSSESSPTCSTPSTPLEFIEPMSVKERLGLQFDLEGAGNGEIDGIEAIRIHARKLSSFNRLGHGGMGSEPSTSFRTFVKQILTATLISPEDLILALYFIQKLPVEKIILPTKATGLDGLSERESAIKAAPFKLILGAIMLANKTLQDNSYRNETFAAVSGIPLKDVNALEVHLFGALDFNVNIGKIEWNTFLVGLIQSNRFNGKVSVEAFEIGRILTRLLNGNERKSGLNSMRFVDEKSQLFF